MTKTKKPGKSFGSLNRRFKLCQHLILKSRELFRFDISLRNRESVKLSLKIHINKILSDPKILVMSGFSRLKNKNIYFYTKFQALRFSYSRERDNM